MVTCTGFVFINLLSVGQPTSGLAPTNVTMIQLIATAEKYDGKLIRVIGFLSIEFEGNALYLHQEDYEQNISRDAVWVDIGSEMAKQKEVLNKHYVLLEGTFSANERGHMGAFGGAIKDVERAVRNPTRLEIEKMLSH